MKDYSNIGIMGVCVALNNDNYGSMLQSYATQRMLCDYGINYELIQYKKRLTPAFLIKSFPRVFNQVFLHEQFAFWQKRRFLKKHPELKPAVEKRKAAFSKFRKSYFLAPIKTYIGYDRLVQESKKYNSFLVGSDQLWSPSGLASNFYNLMFTEKEKVKISYASSFGVKEIPNYQAKRTKKYLNRIQFISCRENSGSDIVKKLTGRSVPVVVDPTMLFTGEQWNDILPCKRVVEGKYIFSYVLGPDKNVRAEIAKLKEKTGLPIVSIHQYLDADLDFGDVVIDDAGPAEFVDLIRNAEYVCTDSFHGSVFSALNHKKFVVFNRYLDNNKSSKNTRIESFCINLGLEKRRFSGDIYLDMIGDIDYKIVDAKMEKIRKLSIEYLETAFDSIK